MNFTSDTSFFIRMGEGSAKALQIWAEIKEGKGRLTVPTIVISELKRNYLKKGLIREIKELLENLVSSSRITILSLTPDLASAAGSVAYAHNMTVNDGIVLASAMASGSTNLLTADPIFLRAQKDGKIKVIVV